VGRAGFSHFAAVAGLLHRPEALCRLKNEYRRARRAGDPHLSPHGMFRPEAILDKDNHARDAMKYMVIVAPRARAEIAQTPRE